MRWLLGRCEVLFDRLGYDYPPSYVLIADAALLAFCASATIQRYVSGVSGADWIVLGVVWVIALWLTAGELAICSLDISRAPIISMMPVMIIAAVVLFWCVPLDAGAAHGDVAPLLLVLGAAMCATVTPIRLATVHLLMFLTAVVAGTAVGATDLGWIIGGMIGLGWATGSLLQKQLQLMHAERRERAKQYALDRAGIAAEVHDVVAHSLSIVLLNVTAARRAIESGQHPETDGDIAEALDALRDAERQGRSAMSDVRRTIELLRNESTPEQAQPGLADITALVDGFRRAGSSVTAWVQPPAVALSSTTELAVYRVVQESLSNASKHADGAPVSIALGPGRDSKFIVHVSNPVKEGKPTGVSGGYGLAGMTSRVGNLGGTLRAGVNDGRWCVEAVFAADTDDSTNRTTDDTAGVGT